jgi:hypothetical protein
LKIVGWEREYGTRFSTAAAGVSFELLQGRRPTKLPHLSVSMRYEINELCKLSATARRILKTEDTSSKCVGMVGENV